MSSYNAWKDDFNNYVFTTMFDSPRLRYSFAITGINLTHMACSLLQSGAAKKYFDNAPKNLTQLSDFHEFYCYLFISFDELWREEEPENMMEFPRIKS